MLNQTQLHQALSTTAWSFTAGQTTGTGAEQIGFHQGTTIGCPTSIDEIGARSCAYNNTN